MSKHIETVCGYRFVPDDQICSMKNCGSQDSGVIVSGSTETMSQDTLDSPLRTNYNFLSVGGETQDGEDDGDTDELQNQFVKCRRGIRLFRDVSDQSRSPENIREQHPGDDTKQWEEGSSKCVSGDHEQNLCDIVSVMAATRMEDQRCRLGGNHNTTLPHLQSKKEGQLVRINISSFLFSHLAYNPGIN